MGSYLVSIPIEAIRQKIVQNSSNMSSCFCTREDTGVERAIDLSTTIGWAVGLRFRKAFTIIRISPLRKGHEHERNFRVSPF